MFDVVKYESSFGEVELSPETVMNYLVKGRGNVTEQEIIFFMKMCEAQKLNPFVQGEVYLIKYGDSPAQMVIGYDTYKRRAEDNPAFIDKESGIIVKRGNEVIKKAGACLYPGEQLLGGWCRVTKLRNGREVAVYKECTFSEYNSGKSTWKEKPCMMIEKVAVSQALREAFPKDFEGLYTTEEMSRIGETVPTQDFTTEQQIAEVMIAKEQRVEMYGKARQRFGKEGGDEVIRRLVEESGYESTRDLTASQYEELMEKLEIMLSEAV